MIVLREREGVRSPAPNSVGEKGQLIPSPRHRVRSTQITIKTKDAPSMSPSERGTLGLCGILFHQDEVIGGKNPRLQNAFAAGGENEKYGIVHSEGRGSFLLDRKRLKRIWRAWEMASAWRRCMLNARERKRRRGPPSPWGRP